MYHKHTISNKYRSSTTRYILGCISQIDTKLTRPVRKPKICFQLNTMHLHLTVKNDRTKERGNDLQEANIVIVSLIVLDESIYPQPSSFVSHEPH